MLLLNLLFVVGDPNPVTAEQNYFSGLHLTHKCLHFNLLEISDRIHEVICIDHLLLKRGVYRAEREADSAAHTCR